MSNVRKFIRIFFVQKDFGRDKICPFWRIEHQEPRKIIYCIIVKLREREGQRVYLGRSLKGHLWMVDGGYPFPDALH